MMHSVEGECVLIHCRDGKQIQGTVQTIKPSIHIYENEASELPRDCKNYDIEIFQYYIISPSGAEILQDWTNEIVFYNEDLNMYVWGVTHWGTSWDYVLTEIKLNCDETVFE